MVRRWQLVFIIAQANLAGYAVGPMQVSTQHSNFLINRGGATAQEAHRTDQLYSENY